MHTAEARNAALPKGRGHDPLAPAKRTLPAVVRSQRQPYFNLSHSLEFRTFILLCIMMFFGTVGNALLDKAMKSIGWLDLSSKAAIWSGAIRTFQSGAIWLGIACLLLYMVSQMLALSRADYSFVMPFTAMSYALVPLAGYLWLGEAVPGARWVGIALIVCGVILVSRTPANTTGTRGSMECRGNQ